MSLFVIQLIIIADLIILFLFLIRFVRWIYAKTERVQISDEGCGPILEVLFCNLKLQIVGEISRIDVEPKSSGSQIIS